MLSTALRCTAESATGKREMKFEKFCSKNSVFILRTVSSASNASQKCIITYPARSLGVTRLSGTFGSGSSRDDGTSSALTGVLSCPNKQYTNEAMSKNPAIVLYVFILFSPF
jgi:hypothetical protein